MTTVDPYRTLGVASTATIEEIKSAFRRLAKETHPDLHGPSPSRVERFRAVAEAYAILSDPVQRARYDSTGVVDQERVTATREDIYAAVAYVEDVRITVEFR